MNFIYLWMTAYKKDRTTMILEYRYFAKVIIVLGKTAYSLTIDRWHSINYHF